MKLKVVRVVTAGYIVPWHMHNTLVRAYRDFDVTVIGENVSTFQLSYPDIKFIDLNIDRKPNLISDFINLIKLYRIISDINPDILHSIMPKAGLLAALAGYICRTPVRIHTFTGQTWSLFSGLRRHMYILLDKIINKLNSDCLTDSPSQSAFLYSHGISNNGNPLPVLLKGSLSGVDVTRHNKSNADLQANILASSLKIKEDDFIFGYLARKTRDKGAIDILFAFNALLKSIPINCKLLFVGPDEDNIIYNLKKNSNYLFDNVIEIDHVSNPEVYLSIMDVLCLPSYREGFGSIVIDAAALSIPTVGSRIPGLIDSIADGETGILCSAGDLNEFKDAMCRLISEPEYLYCLGSNAKKRVDNFFTADLLYAELKDFYLSKYNLS